MRILGVDPGLGASGYGVIEITGPCFKLVEAGIIKSNSRQALEIRLSRLYNNIQNIISEYKPSYMVLENLYSHYKHHMTAIAMAHARGVIVLAAASSDKLKLVNYPAKRAKKALTGNGNASKAQVQYTVQRLLNLKQPPAPYDVSDALSLALAHAYIVTKKGFKAR